MPRKPSDPATIARRTAERRRKDFASVDLAPEAADLPQNAAVLVEPVTRADPGAGVKGNEKRAQRQDVFARLYARSALTTPQLDAVRRLERDMAERRGEGDGGGGGLGTRVDCARPIPVSDRSIAAAERVEAAFARIGRRDAELLTELLEPRRVLTTEAERWRVVVRLITGETHSHAQGAAIRAAADNLAQAYRECDHSPRRAA